MEFQEYREFVWGRMKNAPENRPTLTRVMYFALKLNGEASELLEHIRNAAGEKLILKECGDVLWYCVASAKDLGLEVYPRRQEVPPWINFKDTGDWADAVNISAGNYAETLGKAMRDDDYGNTPGLTVERADKLKHQIEAVMFAVAGVANCFGKTIADVAAINVAKLQDRDARDVVRGDGDER